MKKISILLSATLLLLSANAQQLNLQSRMYFARLTANPALTAYNGSTNVYGFFRDQWSGALSHPRMYGGIGELSLWGDRIGTGIEVTGYTGGITQLIDAKLYYAQKIKLAADHRLSLGVSGGMLQRSFHISQADREMVDNDPSLNTPNATLFDMSIGLAYQWKKLTIGFAIPNLLDANKRVYGNRVNITDFKRNYLINGSYEVSIAQEKFNIEPGFLLKINELKQVALNLQVMANYKRTIFLGMGYDLFGGMPITAGVRISKIFTVAYTYQVPLLQGVPFTPSIYSTHELTVGVCFDKWMKKGDKEKDVAANAPKQTAYDSLLSRKASADSLSATQKAVDSLALKLGALERELEAAKQREKELKSVNIPEQPKAATPMVQTVQPSAAVKQEEPAKPATVVTTTAPAATVAKTEKTQPAVVAPVQAKTEEVAKPVTTAKPAAVVVTAPATAVAPIKTPAATATVQPIVTTETTKQAAAPGPKEENLFSKEVLSQVAPVAGSRYVLDKLSFEGNGSTLSSSSYAQLDDLLTYLLKYQNTRVRIVAHGDNTSDEISGFRSELRAKAIVEYLHSKGIDYGRVSGFGMGPRKPIADNATEEGRATNRRVEVEIK